MSSVSCHSLSKVKVSNNASSNLQITNSQLITASLDGRINYFGRKGGECQAFQ